MNYYDYVIGITCDGSVSVDCHGYRVNHTTNEVNHIMTLEMCTFDNYPDAFAHRNEYERFSFENGNSIHNASGVDISVRFK